MADPAGASGGRAAWWAVVALLGSGALALVDLAPTHIDWQPSLALTEPWRAVSAVWVHYSRMHLWANLAGALLVGLLGHVAGVPVRSVGAWLAAWPMTQAALALEPRLLHYGGLSGVLHAGVGVVAVHLLCVGSRSQRIVAALLLGGLLVKVIGEAPWAGPLRQAPGWDIAVAPAAHLSGTLCGLLCSALAEWLRARRVGARRGFTARDRT